jgi:hypothetical protein
LWAGVALITFGTSAGLTQTPADYLQGESVRILYIHVPSAWLGVGGWTGVAVSSGLSRSAAPAVEHRRACDRLPGRTVRRAVSRHGGDLGTADLVVAAVIGAALLAMSALKDQAAFFYAPSDLAKVQVPPGTAIRLGGMVERGSIRKLADGITTSFVLTDNLSATPVAYRGILPDLFREGIGRGGRRARHPCRGVRRRHHPRQTRHAAAGRRQDAQGGDTRQVSLRA